MKRAWISVSEDWTNLMKYYYVEHENYPFNEIHEKTKKKLGYVLVYISYYELIQFKNSFMKFNNFCGSIVSTLHGIEHKLVFTTL